MEMLWTYLGFDSIPRFNSLIIIKATFSNQPLTIFEEDQKGLLPSHWVPFLMPLITFLKPSLIFLNIPQAIFLRLLNGLFFPKRMSYSHNNCMVKGFESRRSGKVADFWNSWHIFKKGTVLYFYRRAMSYDSSWCVFIAS